MGLSFSKVCDDLRTRVKNDAGKVGRAIWSAAATSAVRVARLWPGLDRDCHVEERLSGPWPSDGPYLWLHGASLGECRMLLGLARALLEDLPNAPKILLTSQKVEVVAFLRDSLNRPTDKLDAQSAEPQIEVALAPADIPSTLEKFVRSVNPLGLILAENELWPGYLSMLSRISPRPSIALVSGRYRRSLPGLDFKGMALASMQTSADLGRFSFVSKGVVPCVVGGDWKLLSWAREGARVSVPENPAVDVAFLSFHAEESESLVDMAEQTVALGESAVLVPRRLSEISAFRHGLLNRGLRVVEWPDVQKGAVSVVSQFGLVREVLAQSRSAVVGGSFSRCLGVHDFWEPLQMGVSTCVGPYVRGHEDVVEMLVAAGALSQIGSAAGFASRDRAPVERVQRYLANEKKKIDESYLLLLQFLRNILQ